MKSILVIAPHPDDETLGCGGTLLRSRAEGAETHWLIVTGISKEETAAVEAVSKAFDFSSSHRLPFPASRLDTVPVSEVVAAIGTIVRTLSPTDIYLPYPGDAHTDHQAAFASAAACTKWFRYPSVSRVLAYETLSETDCGIDPRDSGFRPNIFIDIADHLEKKVEIMKLYAPEMRPFPFPRCEEGIRAQAMLRGTASGFRAAEAFMLLRERR